MAVTTPLYCEQQIVMEKNGAYKTQFMSCKVNYSPLL